MYSKPNEGATDLWAILNEDGTVRFSRGGSSTKPHLMVYPTKASAMRALPFVTDKDKVSVECIYTLGYIRKVDSSTEGN